MDILQSGGVVFGARLNAKEKKAMKMEIQRQLAEYTRKYHLELEALYLREMRSKHHHGEKRLREDFDAFGDALDALIKRFELEDDDKIWMATYSLKEEGFDIEQWHREKYPNEGNFA